MRISVLTPNLSSNCLGRAYILARVLQKKYSVEIIGPAFTGKIWEVLTNQNDVNIKLLPGNPLSGNIFRQMDEVRKSITGDIIYASKPMLVNYGSGILEKLLHRKPLILDIDDWDLGFRKEELREIPVSKRMRRYVSGVRYLTGPNSYWNSFLGEKLVCFADEITVSNSYLQSMFGGIIVPHGRCTDTLDPLCYDRDSLRQKFQVSGEQKIVAFIGTPRKHKGVEDLIRAVRLLQDRRVLLMLVGLNNTNYCNMLVETINRELGQDQARLFGIQPFEALADFLSISDVIVIPQRKNYATVGQVPAKVFDAMAMAKPIIATRVVDLAEILKNCGWVVEPGNPQQIAQAIRYVLDHPDEAEDTGQRAREKCIKQYSWRAMGNVLGRIFEKYER